ncbi:MAG: signal peptidase I [Firmicutes bacterium]|uniref:Signal peptidase I n=1 Tax=Melghirimyces thermohalophilus TaxID=1236220 RepID=A0A1G6IX85_9BACL|nr:signal peptidase I [Melghirimyces thermohalophilus]MDA8353687.1 signal peptidase I [Bacillota bacterium]SDC11182.1 signal peptidase I [Melghirimyces thermohalophilus]
MKLIRTLIHWSISLLIAATLSLLITTFLIEPAEVNGQSMQPTLQDNNYILISKLPNTFDQVPDYGDIVVIDSVINRDRSLMREFQEASLYRMVTGQEKAHNRWLKRVIGRPGDTLEFKDNIVYRNGQLLKEPYLKDATTPPPSDEDMHKLTVPEGHVFVMGDNRHNSQDSRAIGPIPIDHVLGKMIFQMEGWPLG